MAPQHSGARYRSAMAAHWIDLEDPDTASLEAALPEGVHVVTVERLADPDHHSDQPRPRLEMHGPVVLGVLVLPILEGAEVRSIPIDVVMSAERIVTVHPASPEVREVLTEVDGAASSNGQVLCSLFDAVGERFLMIVDDFEKAIDGLEDQVMGAERDGIRARIGELRHAILHVRRVLAPTRDAARRVVDDRLDLESGLDLFDHGVQLRFADTYDKLLRATDGLDLCRDLLAGVRDFLQAEVANSQNEVMKRLTVVASLLLLPTFIVGLYGQNLKGMPEVRWHFGYAFSWALIVVTTVAQLVYFRRRRWI